MSDQNVLTCLGQDLRVVWSADTAVDPEAWSEEHPSVGQCAVSALVVDAIFGGRIVRFDLGIHGTHYANIVEIDGQEVCVDFTVDQFDFDFDWHHNPSEVVSRSDLCGHDFTFRRYQLLSSRLKNLWAAERAGV